MERFFVAILIVYAIVAVMFAAMAFLYFIKPVINCIIYIQAMVKFLWIRTDFRRSFKAACVCRSNELENIPVSRLPKYHGGYARRRVVTRITSNFMLDENEEISNIVASIRSSIPDGVIMVRASRDESGAKVIDVIEIEELHNELAVVSIIPMIGSYCAEIALESCIWAGCALKRTPKCPVPFQVNTKERAFYHIFPPFRFSERCRGRIRVATGEYGVDVRGETIEKLNRLEKDIENALTM